MNARRMKLSIHWSDNYPEVIKQLFFTIKREFQIVILTLQSVPFRPSFYSLFGGRLVSSYQTLFWNLFGNSQVSHFEVRSVNSDTGHRETMPAARNTMIVGEILLLIYHAMAIIVLVNMLIAMMSNSFQTIQVSFPWKLQPIHHLQHWLLFFWWHTTTGRYFTNRMEAISRLPCWFWPSFPTWIIHVQLFWLVHDVWILMISRGIHHLRLCLNSSLACYRWVREDRFIYYLSIGDQIMVHQSGTHGHVRRTPEP